MRASINRKTSNSRRRHLGRLVVVTRMYVLKSLLLTVLSIEMVHLGCSQPQAPYPPSQKITGVSFDFSTHDQRAPGSDNWAITWADDDNQYTTWGDGGGFGGTNNEGRVSLGVARVEGAWKNYRGYNVWGGKDAENRATFRGKSYGIISIDGILYMWRSGAGSNETAYDFQRLYASRDHGASWSPADWEFRESDSIFVPTFLQFGRDYQGARDNYVYIYAPRIKTKKWSVHKPGEIVLMRVPKASLMNRAAYEFFSGFTASGQPQWTADIKGLVPVFEDRKNGVMRTSVSYNSGLRRYFLITEHTKRSRGNIGIYDAPEPWGPWTTVLFQTSFGRSHIQTNSFFWNFSNKWLSSDGRKFCLIFTGKDKNDSWNLVRGKFSIAEF